MERNFILAGIAACAVAATVVVSFTRDQARDADSSNTESTATHSESTPASTSGSNPVRAQRQPSSPIDERRDDALLAHVEHKYRYLLADVESAHVEELKRRLLAHESAENISRKATTDARVSELLSPREREYYQALRDSDVEQHHVAEYAGGVGKLAPLDERQQRRVLDAKLRQKQRYAATLRDAGLDREALSPAERERARAQVAEALQGYVEDFLMEVSPVLTAGQYTLLRDYETNELQRELERLQRQVGSK